MSTNIMESITGISSHQQAAPRGAGDTVEPQFCTTAEVAARLRWSTRTLREKVRTGVFRRGEHFFEPAHTRRFWRWSSVVAWVESEGTGALIINERLKDVP